MYYCDTSSNRISKLLLSHVVMGYSPSPSQEQEIKLLFPRNLEEFTPAAAVTSVVLLVPPDPVLVVAIHQL
jgi:hypothetical protein